MTRSPARPPGQPPTALTIAGSDSSGGSGVQADLKTFLAARVHGLAALTAVTVQNSLGVSAVHEIPPETVAAQISAVASDIGVDAAKTGLLASAPIIEAVAHSVRTTPLGPLVVDPVCTSQHGEPILRPDALDALRALLFPLASLVTPNLFEVRLLTGRDVRDRAELTDAARALHDLGPRWVLVTGGHLPVDEDAVDVLFDGRDFIEFRAARIGTPHTHGSGDTLAAAITAALAMAVDVPTAVAQGKHFATESVRSGYPLGAGRGAVGLFWRVCD